MSQAKSGDTVKIHYTGTLDDGSEFDSSAGRDPLEFQLGGGQVIPGFDQAVDGMSVGEKKSVSIEPADAYGERFEQAVQEVPRSALPDEMDPEVGMALQSVSPDGQARMFTITDVAEETITVDGNHPLAGKRLNFEIELVEVAGQIIVP